MTATQPAHKWFTTDLATVRIVPEGTHQVTELKQSPSEFKKMDKNGFYFY